MEQYLDLCRKVLKEGSKKRPDENRDDIDIWSPNAF